MSENGFPASVNGSERAKRAVERAHRRRDLLIPGIVLILIGSLFLLDRFDVAEFGDVARRFWPMILIVIGAGKVVTRREVWGGLWLITLGTWMQFVVLHIFGLTWGNSWPLILIALGAGIILRALLDIGHKREEPDAR